MSLREDGGEWFATSAFHATPSTDNVAGDANANRGVGSGEVQFDLPTKTSELRSELRAVDADYKARCGRSHLSDADFEYGMRHDSSCDFEPADPSIEEDGDPSEGSNNEANGGE